MDGRWCRFLLLFVAILPRGLAAQYSRPSGAFTLDRLPGSVTREIQAELRSADPDWDRVLRVFFGAGGYDQGVPDLVVYIPRAGASKLALLHKGKPVRNLEGQTFLYFVVFSERSIPESAAAGPQLTVSARSIETAGDAFLTAFVKALASQVGAATPEPELGAGADSVVELTLRDLRADTSSADRLDIAMGRVRLSPNSLNRVTISGADGFPLDPHVSLHYMFGNSDGSWFGASLGVGFTLNVRRPVFEDAAEIATEAYLRSSLYIFGQAYLDRPHLPRDPFSLGLAVGTNLLRGDPLDDLVIGIAVGRLGGLGAIVGANSLVWQELVAGTGQLRDARKWRGFVGLDFRL